jgi:hypothetical protein
LPKLRRTASSLATSLIPNKGGLIVSPGGALMWRLRTAYFLGADPALLAIHYGYQPHD